MCKARPLVICVKCDGYEASPERRTICVAVPDVAAGQHGLRRLIDESGDHDLYRADSFVEVALPQPIRRAELMAA